MDTDGPVAVLTIDRPAKHNSMTHGMWAALPEVLAGPADDPAVRVLVVTGAGPSFGAGADIADLLGGPDPEDPMAALRWTTSPPRPRCATSRSRPSR